MSDSDLLVLSILEDIRYSIVLIMRRFNWKGVKGVRDILTHHYFDLDAETIFMICQDKLNELLKVTDAMIIEMKSKINH